MASPIFWGEGTHAVDPLARGCSAHIRAEHRARDALSPPLPSSPFPPPARRGRLLTGRRPARGAQSLKGVSGDVIVLEEAKLDIGTAQFSHAPSAHSPRTRSDRRRTATPVSSVRCVCVHTRRTLLPPLTRHRSLSTGEVYALPNDVSNCHTHMPLRAQNCAVAFDVPVLPPLHRAPLGSAQ